MTHKYFYLYRPPSYGCQPSGWINQEGGLPQKMYKTQWGELRSFGWVEYTEPLTVEQVWKWEFIPDDQTEYAKYVFWEYAGRNQDDADALIEDYVQAYKTKTGRIPEHLLWAVEILALPEAE